MATMYTPKMFKRDEYILSLYEDNYTYHGIIVMVEKRFGQRLSMGRIYQILAKTGAQRAA
jgi:hypothetical protein